MNKIGLYIHIPFCLKKCRYCDFYSIAGGSGQAKAYIDKACGQIKTLSALCADRECDTVYIGGGTPSILSPRLIAKLLETVFRSFKTAPGAEITIEANPATADRAAFEKYLDAGINRISFGVQTFEDETLKRIGRLHTFDEALAAVNDARAAGFENVSADLMYALPGQKENEISEAFHALKNAGIRHISLYGLKIEKNTPFGRDQTLVLPDEDAQCNAYLDAVKLFENNGFYQYEISNFAQPGYESRHNLRYWKREEYLGIGPAAHSFFDGVRFEIPRDLAAYLENRDFSLSSAIYKNKRRLTEEEEREEELMLALRLKSGYPGKILFETAADPIEMLRYLEMLKKQGFAVIRDGALCLTPEGMLVSSTIISDLLIKTE